MWVEKGRKPALEYISAYFMEWSLSIDNIFVFILIFTSFSVKKTFSACVIDWYHHGGDFQGDLYYGWRCACSKV